jgi:putative FmdB family regulatory protein
MYDFECTHCGIWHEDLVYEFETESKCPNCGKQAAKQIGAPRIWWRKMGVDTSFPTAAAKWEKMQYQKARLDRGGTADGQPNLKEI